MKRKKITIFLASSVDGEDKGKGEFYRERKCFDSFISKLNEDRYAYKHYGIRLVPKHSETGISSGRGGTQTKYDLFIKESRLCIFLIGKHVGDGTAHEYDVAKDSLDNCGHPEICAFFREQEADKTVGDLKRKLEENGIYHYSFAEQDQFKAHLDTAVTKFLEQDLKKAEEEKAREEEIKMGSAIKEAVDKAIYSLNQRWLGVLSMVFLVAAICCGCVGWCQEITDIHVFTPSSILISELEDGLDDINKAYVASNLDDTDLKIGVITITEGDPPTEINVAPNPTTASRSRLNNHSVNDNAVAFVKKFTVSVPEGWRPEKGSGSIIYFTFNNGIVNIKSNPVYVSVEPAKPQFSISEGRTDGETDKYCENR